MGVKAIQLGIMLGLLILSAASGLGAEKVHVAVSISPQKYFVEQIGKDLVAVQTLVQPGTNPHTYEPKPKQMVAFSKAKVYFAIGIEFEKANLDKLVAVNPSISVVHTDHGIKKRSMNAHRHDQQSDQHEKADARRPHDNPSGLDPHIWLSPPLVKVQARAMLKALKEIDPRHHRIYETNYDRFAATIDRLDADLRHLFADKKGLPFLVFHPTWGYFARTYGLKQVPIEMEGKHPKPAQLQALIQFARKNAIRVVFVQPQFSTKSAELVAAEIDGRVAFVDPLAEDWLVNLRNVAKTFKAALR